MVPGNNIPEGLSSSQNSLGNHAPQWMDDQKANACLKCGVKFTIVRRRHHCRACGKVYCSTCCEESVPLAYLNNQEARVCITCYNVLSLPLINPNTLTNYHHVANVGSGTNINEVCHSSSPIGISILDTSSDNQGRVVQSFNDTNHLDFSLNEPPQYGSLNIIVTPPTYSSVTPMDSNMSARFMNTLLNVLGGNRRPSGGSDTTISNENIEASTSDSVVTAVRYSSANTELPPLIVLHNNEIILENVFYFEAITKKVEDLKYLKEDNFLSFIMNQNFILKLFYVRSYDETDIWYMITDGFGAVNSDEIKIMFKCDDPDNFIGVIKDFIEILHNLYDISLKNKKSTEFPYLKFNNHIGVLEKVYDFCGVFFIRKPNEVFIDETSNKYTYIYPILVKKDEEAICRHLPLRFLKILDDNIDIPDSNIFCNVLTRRSVVNQNLVLNSVVSLIGDIEHYKFGFIMSSGMAIEIKSNILYVKLHESYKKSIFSLVEQLTDRDCTMIPLASALNYRSKWLLKVKDFNKKEIPEIADFIEHSPFNHMSVPDDAIIEAVAPAFIIFSYKNLSVEHQKKDAIKDKIAKTSFVEDGIVMYMSSNDIMNIRKTLLDVNLSFETDINWSNDEKLPYPMQKYCKCKSCQHEELHIHNQIDYPLYMATKKINKLIIKWSVSDYSRPPYPKFQHSCIDNTPYSRDFFLKIRHSHDFIADNQTKAPSQIPKVPPICRLIWTDVCFPELTPNQLHSMNRKSPIHHLSINSLMDKLGTVTATFSRVFMNELSPILTLLYEMGYTELSVRVDSINETKDNIDSYFKVGSGGSELFDQLFSIQDYPTIKSSSRTFAKALYLIGQHRIELFYKISRSATTF